MRAILLALLLAACGGGSGGSVQAPVTHRTDLLFGYFGSVDDPSNGPWGIPAPGTPSSVAETGAHSNMVMTGGWGDWGTSDGRMAIAQKAIRHMREAEGFGIHQFVVSVDFCLWGTSMDMPFRGTDDVAYFLGMIRNAGLLPNVVAVYPLDEPNITPQNSANQRVGLLALKALLQSSTDTADIAVFSIFAPLKFGTANMDVFDWVGIDDYTAGDAVFAEFDSVRLAGRKLVLVPGGGAPWQEDPAPFRAYADAHPDVVAIVPFVWFDPHGIRDNPTRSAYVALGCSYKACK